MILEHALVVLADAGYTVDPYDDVRYCNDWPGYTDPDYNYPKSAYTGIEAWTFVHDGKILTVYPDRVEETPDNPIPSWHGTAPAPENTRTTMPRRPDTDPNSELPALTLSDFLRDALERVDDHEKKLDTIWNDPDADHVDRAAAREYGDSAEEAINDLLKEIEVWKMSRSTMEQR